MGLRAWALVLFASSYEYGKFNKTVTDAVQSRELPKGMVLIPAGCLVTRLELSLALVRELLFHVLLNARPGEGQHGVDCGGVEKVKRVQTCFVLVVLGVETISEESAEKSLPSCAEKTVGVTLVRELA